MTPQARDNVLGFDQEQNALLELLAAQINDDQDGGFGTFGYADVDEQANGFFPDECFNQDDTYSFAELYDDFQQSQQDQPKEDPAISAPFTIGPVGNEQIPEADLEFTSDFDIARFATTLIDYQSEDVSLSKLEIEHFMTRSGGYEHTPEAGLEKTSEHGPAQCAMEPAGCELTTETAVEKNSEVRPQPSLPEDHSTMNHHQPESEHIPEPLVRHLAYHGSAIDPIDVDGLSEEEDTPRGGEASTQRKETAAVVEIRARVQERMESLQSEGFFVRTFASEISPKRSREATVTVHILEGPGSYGHKRQKTASPCSSPGPFRNIDSVMLDDRNKDLNLEPVINSTPNIRTTVATPNMTVDNSNKAPDLEPATNGTPNIRTTVASPSMTMSKDREKPPRKSSRPVNVELFTSLELSLETFLILQAAVKDYMLDPDHPDRLTCMGFKGVHESDAVKLKMYSVVKSFLKNEGWGDRCFGSEAKDFRTRTLRWPEKAESIIILLTPVMRRVISNERQRLYAVEKRIARGRKPRSPSKRTPIRGPSRSESLQPDTPLRRESVQPHTPQPGDEEDLMSFDNNFDQGDFSLASSASTVDGHSPPKLQPENSPGKHSGPHESELRYHVNIMKDGRRVQPKVVLTLLACPGFSHLNQRINSMIDELGQRLKRIQVLGPGSLLEARDENTWMEAVDSIRQNEWMDGDVKCVVEVE